jgi:hypothetical protein
MRASVHRSLSNPAATAPRSSTRRTLPSSTGPSWAGLPWRAVRIPAAPPRQRPYHRLAVCAETPSSPATSALVLPWANRSAACRRRRSNHSRSPGCRSTRPLGEIAARLMLRNITHPIHNYREALYLVRPGALSLRPPLSPYRGCPGASRGSPGVPSRRGWPDQGAAGGVPQRHGCRASRGLAAGPGTGPAGRAARRRPGRLRRRWPRGSAQARTAVARSGDSAA